MKIHLESVQFDRDVRGPGARADGADSAKTSTTFSSREKKCPVGIYHDTDRHAVVMTHPTSKERRVVCTPWSRVVQAEELEAPEKAK